MAAPSAAARRAAARHPRRVSDLPRSARLAFRGRTREARRANAPMAVLSVSADVNAGNAALVTPLTPEEFPTCAAAIRSVGGARRVFLLRPHMTSDELIGLAHRLKVLSRNMGISAVIVANTDDDEAASLATPAMSADDSRVENWAEDVGQNGPGYGKAWHVAGGYDPRYVHERKAHEDPTELGRYMDGVRDLALAARGGLEIDAETGRTGGRSKVPVVCVPHGTVNDGGSAVLMGTHVLATTDTNFSILNPGRGLTLDPSGLSFVLPRLGWEHDQPSADYPCGTLLALTGYEADCHDLLETGLATHMLKRATLIGDLERYLAALPSWEAQQVVPPRRRSHGEVQEMVQRVERGRDDEDEWIQLASEFQWDNSKAKNVGVANLVDDLCEYNAAGAHLGDKHMEASLFKHEDPSLVLEENRGRLFEDRSSRLVDVAATFAAIFEQKSVEGILEGLREVEGSQAQSNDEEERECAEIAGSLADMMEARSPLALKVTKRLLDIGKGSGETLEGCMEREKRAQMNMYGKGDFKRWAESGEEPGEFADWERKSLKDVTDDEVEEILGE